MPTEFICTLNRIGATHSSMADWESNTQVALTSVATKVFSHSGMTGKLLNGDNVTGQTSGATGIVCFATDTKIHGGITQGQIMLRNISGTFQSGEVVKKNDDNHVTLSDAGDSVIPVLVIYKDNGDIAESLEIKGAATSSTNYRKITVAEPSRHKGKAGTGAILLPGSTNNGITIREDHAVVEWLEIFGGKIQLVLGQWDNEDNITVRNCIAYNSVEGYSGAIIGSLSAYCSNNRVENCIVYGAKRAGIALWNGGSLEVDNCTVYNCNTDNNVDRAGIVCEKGTLIVKNSIVMGNGNNDFRVKSGETLNQESNISSDNTASGTGSEANIDVTVSETPGTPPQGNGYVCFNNITGGTEDLHIKQCSYTGGTHNDNVAIGAGTNLANIFTDDIDGGQRPLTGAWDIGADEFLAEEKEPYQRVYNVLDFNAETMKHHDYSINGAITGIHTIEETGQFTDTSVGDILWLLDGPSFGRYEITAKPDINSVTVNGDSLVVQTAKQIDGIYKDNEGDKNFVVIYSKNHGLEDFQRILIENCDMAPSLNGIKEVLRLDVNHFYSYGNYSIGTGNKGTWKLLTKWKTTSPLADNKNAFYEAVSQASNAGGGIVYVPPGYYFFDDESRITIPQNVILKGVFSSKPNWVKGNVAPAPYSDLWTKGQLQGSVLLPTDGKDKTGPDAFIKMEGQNSVIDGISVFYPEQNIFKEQSQSVKDTDITTKPGYIIFETDNPHPYVIGDVVEVTGISPDSYDGTYIILERTDTTFTVYKPKDATGDIVTKTGNAVQIKVHTYPWCIDLKEHNCSVINSILVNPYRGIKALNSDRHVIRNVAGGPINLGISVDDSYDFGTLSDVNFWPYWKNVSWGFIKYIKTNGPSENKEKIINNYLRDIMIGKGKAVYMLRADWDKIHNFACWGYGIGFHFDESVYQPGLSQMTNIALDTCRIGILVDKLAYGGLQISNLQYSDGNMFFIDERIAVKIGKDCIRSIDIRGASFFGSYNKAIYLNAKSEQAYTKVPSLTVMSSRFNNTLSMRGEEKHFVVIGPDAKKASFIVAGCHFIGDSVHGYQDARVIKNDLGGVIERAKVESNIYDGFLSVLSTDTSMPYNQFSGDFTISPDIGKVFKAKRVVIKNDDYADIEVATSDNTKPRDLVLTDSSGGVNNQKKWIISHRPTSGADEDNSLKIIYYDPQSGYKVWAKVTRGGKFKIGQVLNLPVYVDSSPQNSEPGDVWISKDGSDYYFNAYFETVGKKRVKLT